MAIFILVNMIASSQWFGIVSILIEKPQQRPGYSHRAKSPRCFLHRLIDHVQITTWKPAGFPTRTRRNDVELKTRKVMTGMMTDEPIPAPESSAVRVALWRAMHVEIDAPHASGAMLAQATLSTGQTASARRTTPKNCWWPRHRPLPLAR
jgi:hypothetical protein